MGRRDANLAYNKNLEDIMGKYLCAMAPIVGLFIFLAIMAMTYIPK